MSPYLKHFLKLKNGKTVFDKDKWIRVALNRKYLVCMEDGTIYRRKSCSADGKTMSTAVESIKPRIHKKSGRVYFQMTFLGICKSVLVNRVMAWAFLPNPQNLPQVNHIDGNKENNALRQADGKMQLEWSTGHDNETHAHQTGLKTGRGSNNSNAKLEASQVIRIRESRETKKVAELAAEFGVARSTIANILAGKTWLHI